MFSVFEKVKEDGIEKKKFIVSVGNSSIDENFFKRLCLSLGKDPKKCEIYEVPALRNDQSYRFDDDCNLILIEKDAELVAIDEIEDYEEPQEGNKPPLIKQRKVIKNVSVSKQKPPLELRKVY
jgi:hypothetical protein